MKVGIAILMILISINFIFLSILLWFFIDLMN
jgi:hypothetical protein